MRNSDPAFAGSPNRNHLALTGAPPTLLRCRRYGRFALAPALVLGLVEAEAHIANLRRKTEPADGERLIHTDHGVGYRLADVHPDGTDVDGLRRK